eukprot:gene12778-3512_t
MKGNISTDLSYFFAAIFMLSRSIALKNVALNKPTKQSSTFNGSVPSIAVDGNSSNMFCSQTGFQTKPWWRVELMDTYTIDCAFHSGSFGQGETKDFFCSTMARGSYVSIQLLASGYLSLVEVQVFVIDGNLSCRGESKAWIAGIVSLIVAIFCCWRASVAKKRNAPTSAPAPPAARAPPAASATPPPASHSRQESSENGRRYSDPVLGTDDNQTVRKNTSAPPPIAFIPLPNVAPPRYDEIYKWDNTATATPPPLYSNLDINTLPSVSISDTSSPAVLSCYNPAFNLDEGATGSFAYSISEQFNDPKALPKIMNPIRKTIYDNGSCTVLQQQAVNYGPVF